MNVIHIGGQRFTGPAGWAEVTARQFRQYLNWLSAGDGEPAGLFALLQLWYGIRYRHTRLLTDDQRIDLLAVLDWTLTSPERWLLPRLRVGIDWIIGPGDGLDYLSFGEFMHAQAAYDAYLDSHEAEPLARLVASLYRFKAKPWQRMGEAGRQLFDNRYLERQTRQISGLPVVLQQGVVLNFKGCLAQFPTQFPHLFSGKGGEDTGSTWLDVGLSLARQTGALGTFAQLEQTSLFIVLTTLDAIMKENKELESRLKK